MIITIKTLYCRKTLTFSFDVDQKTTVKELKKKLEMENKSYDINRQRLIYAGKVLDDDAEVGSYVIDENDFLVLKMLCLICNMCNLNDEDNVVYGEEIQKNDFYVHYYCLLLSTDLPQSGLTSSGIKGFLIRHIKMHQKKIADIFCHYCGQNNASIKCDKCEKYFHLKCGVDNKCVNQFFAFFISFCHEHHNIEHKHQHEQDIGCSICREKMGTYNPVTSITAPCCTETENGWVHQKCLKQFALSAGYYFQCLWCQNKKFREYALSIGIFVPDMDALWEKESGAFSELYLSRKSCLSSKCVCPKGNNYFNSNKWTITSCSMCGAFTIHELCVINWVADKEFICEECTDIINKKHMEQHSLALQNISVAQGSFMLSQPLTFSNEMIIISTAERSISFLNHQKNVSSISLINWHQSFKSNTFSKNKTDLLHRFQENKFSIFYRKGKVNAVEAISKTSCISIDECNGTQMLVPDTKNLGFEDMLKSIIDEEVLEKELVEISDDSDCSETPSQLIEAMGSLKTLVPKPIQNVKKYDEQKNKLDIIKTLITKITKENEIDTE